MELNNTCSDSKESVCNVGDFGLIPGSKDTQEKEEATQSSLPGEFHGQRRLEGYSPWGHKESDMAERLTLSFFQ